MKKVCLTICIVLLFTAINAQDKNAIEKFKPENSVGIWSSAGICELSRPKDRADIVAAHGTAAFSYGLSFTRSLSRKVKLETGLFYTKYCLVDHIVEEPYFNFYAKEYFQILSIPILVKYFFPHDYFISGGAILDLGFERNMWNISDSQNGVAMSIGAGKEITTGKFSFIISTNLDLHAAIPFSGDLSQQKFFVPGIKFGLNYNLN